MRVELYSITEGKAGGFHFNSNVHDMSHFYSNHILTSMFNQSLNFLLKLALKM